MTAILVTIDTELSPAAHQRGVSASDNFATAILGRVSDGEWGVAYQANMLQANGLKAVFFVEALCASVFGLDLLKRTVEPILSAGQAVQLHIHAEWLQWMAADPVDGRRGRCIADFGYNDQCRLIGLGIENLVAAGAPVPVAFRAGNYGANNETLRALASNGIGFDTSYNLPFLGRPCGIVAERPLMDPAKIDGVVEVPISFFEDYPRHARAAQICAVSASEMRLVVEQSVAQRRQTAVIVGHSFELLNRARTRADRIVVRRFERLCEVLSRNRADAPTKDFAELDSGDLIQPGQPGHQPKSLRSGAGRTARRMLQQAMGTVLYR